MFSFILGDDEAVANISGATTIPVKLAVSNLSVG